VRRFPTKVALANHCASEREWPHRRVESNPGCEAGAPSKTAHIRRTVAESVAALIPELIARSFAKTCQRKKCRGTIHGIREATINSVDFGLPNMAVEWTAGSTPSTHRGRTVPPFEEFFSSSATRSTEPRAPRSGAIPIELRHVTGLTCALPITSCSLVGMSTPMRRCAPSMHVHRSLS
jgi:hypothetical protein